MTRGDGRATRVVDPDMAGIYYWPPGGDIAIVYDDLGRSVPPPGMVRLGSVDGGPDTLARAGNRFTVWIDRA
ncbi:cyclophilin-like fold protein [Streptosporangium sp. NPDC048865]|uniref:cyclophilin-like fold protein n=1 Tax=Streptosporangium sp. NPDC048865 TaxID=3155766 RepID=UPI003440A195